METLLPKKATMPLMRAKAPPERRVTIEVKRAMALSTWRATISLERSVAPLARVICPAQLIPVPVQQEESQRKFPLPSQGFVGVRVGGASGGRDGLEVHGK